MTLPVSNVVNVSVSIAALAAGPRSFGSLLILGTTSGVISTTERIRLYSDIASISSDFGVDSNEYKAAVVYFSQSPKPRTLYIGHWDKTSATPEKVTDAVSACLDSLKWYGLVIADDLADSDVLSVASLIEAASPSRLYGHTTQDVNVLDKTSTDNIGVKLAKAKYKRTFWIYSSSSKYADVSVFGRAFTVNFEGTNTTITLKFKQLPGITAEDLKVSQAANITANNGNVYASYNNDTAILQEGAMSDGSFFDEVHGLDWYQNALETALWNLYYTTTTKIPQTPAGMNRQCAVLEKVAEQGVTNGLLAGGVWNGDEFGTLKSGDYLTKGYYVFANSLDDQLQSERESRKAPVFQMASKLAGAIHFADVIVSVNR
ncbi:DUF3383 family protein [Acinetobacter rathckeae]|uniref:DUF3383 family protein n=1 Tax=Acinetobacter rathckeae TaxID=2605272 RepID=UPI0018A32260|nr:DUF3383 family protein [Acinetobacter rathckeae]MBF7687079.1 DUF3383 family protein [Acinetobacter rathckeae]